MTPKPICIFDPAPTVAATEYDAHLKQILVFIDWFVFSYSIHVYISMVVGSLE